MRERYLESDRRYGWIVYSIGAMLVGALGGYVLSVQGSARPSAPAAPPVAAAAIADEGILNAYRNILANDPRNLQAAVAAANLLYDAQRYVEAIAYYQQAFALNGSDVNVSTDLGTALWYAGRPDDALAQYETSLKIQPTHAQTLLNMGIVKADGKHDYAGAIAAWEQLLATGYKDAARVNTLLADARSKLGNG